ncbi:MAG: HDOD domain-containing protein [Betaproteobacteria bacterium]|nr:HDOD domain-containing protein [Betaproteobacteria bacterium]MCL2885899.1 HDOD domain-containing protein [Betaproteobacteria bacterium]
MNVLPDEKQLEKLLNGVDIPPCPVILLDINRELRKESMDQREVARLIGQDVALAGHVMQVANSPAFGGHRIASIVQALNILGVRQLFNMVVWKLLKVALADAGSAASMERFWETSALTAHLSAELARRLRCVRPDIAYTFGLFHDCGIPLLMKRFPQVRSVLAEANACEEGCFTDIEDRHLGTNHAIVGYFLARRWRLPSEVGDAILHHHDYAALNRPGTLSSTGRLLIAVSVLAEHIIRLQANDPVLQEWHKAAPYACPLFGLSLAAVDDLIEDMRDWLG